MTLGSPNSMDHHRSRASNSAQSKSAKYIFEKGIVMRSRGVASTTHKRNEDIRPSSKKDSLDEIKIRPRQRWSFAPLMVGSIILMMIVLFLWIAPTDRSLAATSSQAVRDRTSGLGLMVRNSLLRPPTGPSSVAEALKDPATCRYDGQCPTGTTCAVASHHMLGTCETIARVDQTKVPNSAASEACVRACQKELEVDEHFYQETWPVVEWSEPVSSQGRPAGCTLVYHREPEGKRWDEMNKADAQVQWKEVPASIIKWDKGRFRHVIRVDPHLPNDFSDDRWMAYCLNPCESDSDCATKNDGPVPGYICVEGACQRNPKYWEADEPEKMYLVSGATASYFDGLKNLAASARYWSPKSKMVVYNLGDLSEQQKAEIRTWKNVVALEWPDGIPSTYPEHLRFGKLYAWKPVILNETVHRYKKIFWLDAGATLAGPMDPVENVLERTGMFLVKGQDNAMHLSHPDMYKYFGFNKGTFKGGPHYAGNTQAHIFKSRYIDSVVIPNARCSLDINCISPAGSSLNNHRYDQTSLSILAYQQKVRAPHYTEFLAAELSQLKPDLREPSFKLVWTARQACTFYTQLSQRGEISMDKQ